MTNELNSPFHTAKLECQSAMFVSAPALVQLSDPGLHGMGNFAVAWSRRGFERAVLQDGGAVMLDDSHYGVHWPDNLTASFADVAVVSILSDPYLDAADFASTPFFSKP